MIGYSERTYFSPRSVEAYQHARALVDRVPVHTSSDGREIRCHELARAVACRLVAEGFPAEAVDGSLWSIEHTWILLPGQDDSVLIDVYAPGRIPQVQLIYDWWLVSRGRSRGYERTRPRLDIRHAVVDELVVLMGRAPVVEAFP